MQHSCGGEAVNVSRLATNAKQRDEKKPER
jgi:hypothetical protein